MRKDLTSVPCAIDYSVDEAGAMGVLRIWGALTEGQVEEMSKHLESVEPHVNYFKINLENVTAVDLGSIQALYSTCKKLDQSNKTLTMDGICPVTFTSAVENMGLSNHKWLCFGQL